MVLRPQRILSLCSGAGGLDLGVHDALGGCARTVCYVEHETTACEVLVARIQDHALDDAPIWTDLHTFDARGWRGRVDGVIGGYPCQPFSVAGKRLGTADPRHLWPSIARIIAECEPGWCFFENVGGHLRLGYFDVVRPDLERLGYRVAEGIFTAAEVGAPHQRERLFILAHRESGHVGNATEWKRREDSSGGGGDLEYTARSQRSRGTGSGADSERWAAPGPGAGDSAVADRSGDGGREDAADVDASSETLPPFPPGPGDADAWRRILAVRPDLAPALSINEEWELGIRFPLASPSPKSEVRGLANGLEPRMDLTRTAQLRITGNGVVPQCAALAFRTLWGKLADAGHTEREEWANDG